MIDEQIRQNFTETVWEYYQANGRHALPWRLDTSPYSVMVSELMLQQTQVQRVIPKYELFIKTFPTIQALASAELGNVLKAWSGLGYNRRAKFLHQAAQVIAHDFDGRFPEDVHELMKLPGIGKNTAGAISAYAFNQPTVFVETNIRTVFIHHFFADSHAVPDNAVSELVAQTIDQEHPREWYWALMDYGAYLKQTVGNRNHQSKHYTKQSKFAGSNRQIRGQVIRLLSEKPRTKQELSRLITDKRLSEILEHLTSEELIQKQGTTYKL